MKIYIIGIAVSFMIYMIVSIFVGRKVKDADDFYVAGRRAPVFLIVGSMIASYVSTGMFMGDAGEIAGKRLVARYGDALKSDICQPAHHGQDGATEEVYQAIAPTACLWCTPDWLWENNNYLSNDPATVGKGPFTTLETRAWMEKLGVTEHYIAKDGEQVISL